MKKIIDCVGKKYGKLLVLEELRIPIVSTQKYRTSLLHLKCQCECGNIVITTKGNILYRKTTQCRDCQNSHITLGEKIGTLTVLSRIKNSKPKKYLCKCDCGFEDTYGSRFLLHGKKICCKKCKFPKKYTLKIPKKNRKESIIETNFLKHIKVRDSLIGKKNGRLKIIAFSHWKDLGNRRRAYYKAKCKCGNEVIVRDCFATKSCGCLQKESIPKGENQKYARLTNSQAIAIREFKKSNIGYTNRQIAKIFAVSEQIISRIITGKTYKETKNK